MTSSHRVGLLAICMPILLVLNACQPTTEDNTVMTNEEIVTTDIEENDTSDNNPLDTDSEMSNDGRVIPDDTAMTDVLKDYSKSITQMHNEMMIGMGYNDPDTAFAKSMLGHHRGAVDMAKLELKHGNDSSIRQLAEQIMTTQQLEIDILNKWLASHPDTVNAKPETPAMQQALAQSIDKMQKEIVLGSTDPMPDLAYAKAMLPHHIGALDIAKLQIKYGKDEEMRQLAQQIIQAQPAEIELMQNWIATYSSDDSISADNASSPDNDLLEDDTERQE